MSLLTAMAHLDKLTLMEITDKGSEYMRANMNPFCSQKKKDELLNKFLGSLTEEGFAQVAPIIVMELQFSKERAEKFETTEAQLEAYLKRRPIMESHRDMIWLRMKEFRQGCNLPV